MWNEFFTVVLGATPVLELRGAIPIAMGIFEFSPVKVYVLAVTGNLIPIIPFYIFLDKFSHFLMHRYYFFNRLLSWLFDRTQRVHGDHFHNWKWTPVALFLFVAIPLPMTGMWSGVVAAVVFGVPFWRSVAIISAGVLTSGVIVITLSILGFMGARSLPFI